MFLSAPQRAVRQDRRRPARGHAEVPASTRVTRRHRRRARQLPAVGPAPADLAVEQLARDVGVAGVPRGLLEHVVQHPSDAVPGARRTPRSSESTSQRRPRSRRSHSARYAADGVGDGDVAARRTRRRGPASIGRPAIDAFEPARARTPVRWTISVESEFAVGVGLKRACSSVRPSIFMTIVVAVEIEPVDEHRPLVGEAGRDTSRPAHFAYIDSISSSNFWLTTFRFILSVGVTSPESTPHGIGQDRELLDLLLVVELGVHLVDVRLDRRRSRPGPARATRRSVGLAVLLRPRRCVVRIERDQRRRERRLSAIMHA